MDNIFLKKNKGFSWFCENNVCVKGYLFDKQNKYFEKENLPIFFKNVKNESDFLHKLEEINGVFTVIINIKDKIFIASDITRIFPIFYTLKNNKLLISDDIEFLKDKLKIDNIDNQFALEFISAGHTLGNTTLLKDIFQIQSSEFIIFNKNENRIINHDFFYSYATDTINESTYKIQKEQAILAFENTFKRLIESLNNKHVALPLSGGYDSRLIAVMLKKHGYENVTCFTYGRKGNFELKNSKKVAEILGYKWIFIEYNNELIENYINTDIFKRYVHFVGKFSSMPFLQEYFAVKYLKDNNIIPNNSIFIPGHSGDLLGGSQFIKVIPENFKIKKIENFVFDKKFFFNPIPPQAKKQAKKTINKNLNYYNNNNKIAYSLIEDYDIKEKIAKFINNSSCVYNYFGYELRFPFWDIELVTFFKTVPFKYKKLKILYDDILKNTYFKQFNVNFKTEIQPNSTDFFKKKLKDKLKKYLAYSIKQKYINKSDWTFYKEATMPMQEQMDNKNIKYNKKVLFYNSIILQWYIEFCNENL